MNENDPIFDGLLQRAVVQAELEKRYQAIQRQLTWIRVSLPNGSSNPFKLAWDLPGTAIPVIFHLAEGQKPGTVQVVDFVPGSLEVESRAKGQIDIQVSFAIAAASKSNAEKPKKWKYSPSYLRIEGIDPETVHAGRVLTKGGQIRSLDHDGFGLVLEPKCGVEGQAELLTGSVGEEPQPLLSDGWICKPAGEKLSDAFVDAALAKVPPAEKEGDRYLSNFGPAYMEFLNTDFKKTREGVLHHFLSLIRSEYFDYKNDPKKKEKKYISEDTIDAISKVLSSKKRLGFDLDDILKLKDELKKLPEDEKRILTGVYFDEIPQEKIAEDLGLTYVYLRKKLERIKKKLKERLEKFLFDQEMSTLN